MKGPRLQTSTLDPIKTLRTIGHTAGISSLIGLYAGKAVVARSVMRNRVERLQYCIDNISLQSQRALKLMNFEISTPGFDANLMRTKNFLVISNHMSYVDILVTSSIFSGVYVTSVDMGQAPFLGQMTELGGCIHVERRNRSQVERDLSTLTQALRDGFHVMLYPEGTSSNGDSVLPFKKSLLMAAVEAERDILPICIKYTEINGEPFSPANRDLVTWYGDMNFLPHFTKLMTLKNVKAEVHFLDPIAVTKDSTRQELADKTYAAISNCYMSGRN